MPCPFCTDSSDDTKIHWILCDVCENWCHQICVNVDNVLLIDQFHCPHCEKTHGPSTFKQQRRSRRSSAVKLNYADLNNGTSTGDDRIWAKILGAKSFAPDNFPRYKAKEVSLDLIRKTGLRQPFIVEEDEPELDMKMPSKDITVYEIAELVGGKDYPVDVIDVASQSELSGWTMGRWADYFHSAEKDRIRNVISLEISGSKLGEQVTRPRIVRELDWTELMWRTDLHPGEFPRVQLYCLMSVKDSYTDFHIDFGGSSVFYHVLRGKKVFYFIEPTLRNLKKYQKWSSSPDQSTVFLGDEVKFCHAVELQAGNTMIIPSGWIHAVFTPEDSIVIGGNFLHSFHVQAQAEVYAIEDITQVPLKFRYPFYKRLNWYALETFNNWLSDEKKRKELSNYELESMFVLANFLERELQKSIENTASSNRNADNNNTHTSAAVLETVFKKEQVPITVINPTALIHDVLCKVIPLLQNNARTILQDKETDEEKKKKHHIESTKLDKTSTESITSAITSPLYQLSTSPTAKPSIIPGKKRRETTNHDVAIIPIVTGSGQHRETNDTQESIIRKRKASSISTSMVENSASAEVETRKKKQRKKAFEQNKNLDTPEQLPTASSNTFAVNL